MDDQDPKVISIIEKLRDTHKGNDSVIYELPSPRVEMLDYSEIEASEREVDWNVVELFLGQLDPKESQFTFQTLFDNAEQEQKLRGKYGDAIKKFNQVIHADYHDASFRERMQRLNQGGLAIACTINQTDFNGRRNKNIVEARALILDLDGTALKNYKKFPLRPHAIVESSPARYHGYYWVKDFPLKFFSQAQEALALMCGGDTQITDLARSMRLPGTFHNKDIEHIYRARLLFLRAGPRYAGRDILAILGINSHQKTRKAPPTQPKARIQDLPVTTPKILEGERNRTLFKRACRLQSRGLTTTQILKKLTHINHTQCTIPLESGELEDIVKSVRKYRRGKRIPFAWAAHRSRALIRLINRVLAHSNEVYQRFGIPVVIRNVTPPSVLGFMQGVKIPMTIPLAASTLEQYIEKYIRLYKIKDGKECPVGVPRGIAAKFKELPAQDLKLPPINLLLSCPTLRPDGSLLQEPGYDKSTGIYLLLREKWKPINPTPSEAEARAALDRILKLLKHFPFVRECHKSVIVAAMMTAIVRHCFRQAPAFGASAPMYATGKSLLMDIVALILTGKRAPSYNISGREEEMDKFLLSAIIYGITIISIDNFNSKALLKSEALSSFLTQEEKVGRVLGENKIVHAPTCMTVLVNGNNLTLSEDLTSRVLVARIDANREHPERRKIELDLFEYIPKHHQELVNDLLLILLHHLQSKPLKRELPRFGRFEKWSDWLRGSLVRLKMEDPYKVLQEAADDDPDRNEKADFLQAGYTAYRSKPIYLRDLIQDAIQAASGGVKDETEEEKRRATALRTIHDILGHNAKSPDGTISVKSLEKWIRPFKNRIIQGHKFKPTEHKTMYGKEWQFFKKG